MKKASVVVLAVACLSCEGSIVGGVSAEGVVEPVPGATQPPNVAPRETVPNGSGTGRDFCEGVQIGAAPTALRRLTVDEQVNSFRDLLADATLDPALSPVTGAVITEGEVEDLNLAVADMVTKGGHLAFLPCSPTGAFNSTCLDRFIADFGKFAFRRPLTAAEKTWLRTEVFDAIRADAAIVPPLTFREGVDAVAQAVLQSPEVLYVLERGQADTSLPSGIRKLTGFERATRLSYLLWQTTPDATLLAAAGAGTLDDVAGMRAQASRLLASPRAKSALRNFVSAWLELDGNSHQVPLEVTPKDATAFPFDSPELRAAMKEDLLSAYEQRFFAEGSFKELMTSRKAYVNKSLGQLYGVASPPANDSTYAWVDLNPTQRAGLFTRAGFLALYSPQDIQSPISRGVFIYRRAVCAPLGDPPADVNNTPLTLSDQPMTVRQLTEARTAPASCQGCHSAINPIGFMLSNYDAMGRYQTTESGSLNGHAFTLPVDAVAKAKGTDFDGTVNGPLELAQALANSGMAHDCMASQWFEQTRSRTLTANDACNLQRLMRRFRETDDMRDLVLNLATDDGALFVQETP